MLEALGDESWSDLRRAARAFTEAQQTRKRIYNQIGTTKVDGTPRKAADEKPEFPGRVPLLKWADEGETLARDLLGHAWRRAAGKPSMPFRQFVTHTPGLDWYSVARFLGETGHPVLAIPHHWESTPDGPDERVLIEDPPFVRTLRVWWAYCGFGDPERRIRAGMTQEELFACGSSRAKVAAWLVATTGFRSATGKADKNGVMRRAWPWRPAWDSSRERTAGTHPEWKPWRHKKAADRVMTKALLADLYRVGWDDVYARLGLPCGQHFGGAPTYGGKGLAMRQALAEAVERGDPIVVVDEVASMFGASDVEHPTDAPPRIDG